MSFAFADLVDSSKMFLARRSELSGRWDPLMILFRRHTNVFKYPVCRLSELFTEPPQYGAGERGIERELMEQPRYIRITDIDEDGNLSDELGATAATVEKQYLLEDADLLVARSGATVGKSYLHRSARYPFVAFYAGYLIRLRFDRSIVLPEYVFALTQLSYYKGWVRGVQRPTGQPNINAQEYASLEIPLPPLNVQRQIVDALEQAYKSKAKKVGDAKRMLSEVDNLLLAELGIEHVSEPANTIESRIFIRKFSQVTGSRYDPLLYHLFPVALRSMVRNSGQKHIQLRNCITNLVSGDWGEDDSEKYDSSVMERCLVIRNTEFDNDFNLKVGGSREKHRLISKTKLKSLDVDLHDILIEKSGGSIDQPVGRVGIIEPNIIGELPLCFSNFLAKIKVDSSLIDPTFLFFWLKSSHRIGITHSMQSQTNGIRNLVMSEYLRQDIPLPSLDKQARIKENLGEVISRAKQLLIVAQVELEAAKHSIESLILGDPQII